MNRRAFLKAAVAVPLAASLPAWVGGDRRAVIRATHFVMHSDSLWIGTTHAHVYWDGTNLLIRGLTNDDLYKP